jgi:ribosomal-protein-alanine N-acetyltransferase
MNYRTWEMGYWLGKDFWGKGVATSAAKGFSRWAFATFPVILRLEGCVTQGNSASMIVLERAGFVKEGVKRKAVFKNGVAADSVIYGLIREDVEGLE